VLGARGRFSKDVFPDITSREIVVPSLTAISIRFCFGYSHKGTASPFGAAYLGPVDGWFGSWCSGGSGSLAHRQEPVRLARIQSPLMVFALLGAHPVHASGPAGARLSSPFTGAEALYADHGSFRENYRSSLGVVCDCGCLPDLQLFWPRRVCLGSSGFGRQFPSLPLAAQREAFA